ncbi:cell division protein FtsQ/DivIB [Pararhizobium haloflavum]|uniref:cell division protein FtsQ/DivIB n=1 Tax=Pararhizobium haloflavum TaxID=2037914 RepID=UPI001FDF652F|nr:cell division protein FtsQ/DivIB [Pararhizobium haloflavum]
MFALIGKGALRRASAAAAGVAAGRDAVVLPRPLRRVARFLSAPGISDWPIPRHIGAVAALSFLSATGVYGMVLGGHTDHVLSMGTAAAGFALEDVAIVGNRETSEIDVLQAIGLDGARSVVVLDAAAAREALLALPWVADVKVRKIYPSKLEIDLQEREAFAIWQNGSDLLLIEKNGNVIAKMDERKFINLPFYVGLGADQLASRFDRLFEGYPELKQRVRANVRVADRRWDLYLKNGVVVRLPESDPAAAVAELAKLDRERDLLSRDLAAVDMRLSDRITIQLTEESLERHQAAVEQRAKDIKAMERRI